MRHIWKSAPRLQICGTLENYGTLGKMRRIYKNAAHSKKGGTLGKM